MKSPRNMCLNCKYFVMHEDSHNRACTFKGKLRIEAGACLSWRDRYSILDKLQFTFHIKKPRRVSIIV